MSRSSSDIADEGPRSESPAEDVTHAAVNVRPPHTPGTVAALRYLDLHLWRMVAAIVVRQCARYRLPATAHVHVGSTSKPSMRHRF